MFKVGKTFLSRINERHSNGHSLNHCSSYVSDLVHTPRPRAIEKLVFLASHYDSFNLIAILFTIVGENWSKSLVSKLRDIHLIRRTRQVGQNYVCMDYGNAAHKHRKRSSVVVRVAKS